MRKYINQNKIVFWLSFILPIISALLLIIKLNCNVEDGGLLINIATEMFGIFITVTIVNYIIYKNEMDKWGDVEKIITRKLKTLTYNFHIRISEKIKVSLMDEFNPYKSLAGRIDITRLKKALDEKLEDSINKLTGKETDNLIQIIREEKNYLTQIIDYVERKSSLLQQTVLYDIDEKFNNILEKHLLIKLTGGSNCDDYYFKEMVAEIKVLLNALFDLFKRIEKE